MEKTMKIMKSFRNTGWVLAMMAISFSLHAVEITRGVSIPGKNGPMIDLYAKKAQIVTPDGDSIQIWGFAPEVSEGVAGVVQYPGPTIIATAGVPLMVTVTNTDIPQSVSLAFPGQTGVTASVAGPVATGDSVTYTFTPSKPGTYMYHSAESPQIQIDMGLVGALIVRPATAGQAYNDPATAYDREYLFFLSEMDPKLHYLAEDEAAALPQWDNAAYASQLFFINGRNAPDTLAPDAAPELPHQPYGSLVQMHPGERVLVRVLNVGRNQHPLHLHGNHYDQIARDGNLITTTGGALGPVTDYTLNAIPGSTADLIWDWTGEGLGWDIYAGAPHGCDGKNVPSNVFDPLTGEWCGDHGKAIPVIIPENQDLAFGGFYSGSPYLGSEAGLPIGEGGLNPNGGIVFMWHSHSERELTNNDIFPGGMLTMVIVESRD
jgi:FtsP/CotA-like multicopper oxidase with cupredoxin domain